jgi:hypothetical protein
MFYMHLHAHGKPADLARQVKPALDLIGKGAARPAATPTAPAAASTTIDTAKLAQIVGTPGEQSGAVYKITIGRDDLKLTEMGAPINARMGLNTWAAFVGTNDNAAVAGDVAMLADEPCRQAAVTSKAIDESWCENIQVIGPPVMTESPDHLDAVAPSSLDRGPEGGEVGSASSLDQMPANSLPHCAGGSSLASGRDCSRIRLLLPPAHGRGCSAPRHPGDLGSLSLRVAR